MEGFVTLDEVGDEEDLEHQKQRRAGILKSALKNKSGTTEGNAVKAEGSEAENEEEGNGATLKLETSDGTSDAASLDAVQNESTEGEESKAASDKLAVPDEYRIGPYQPNVPVGKISSLFSSSTLIFII